MSRFDPDPVAVRRSLAVSREQGCPWDVAWALATNYHHPSSDDRSLYAFMEKHFRAAYFNAEAPEGRCNVPERDTSGLAVRPPTVALLDYERCRSGDECDRPAVRGRFGRMWCEHHGAELERLARLVGDIKFNPSLPKAA